jgi:hypothetical protein
MSAAIQSGRSSVPPASPPATSRSEQGTRVQQELEILRQKQLAKNQRNKLKDCTYLAIAAVKCTVLFWPWGISQKCVPLGSVFARSMFGSLNYAGRGSGLLGCDAR